MFFDAALPGPHSRSLLFSRPLEWIEHPLGDGIWLDDLLREHAERFPKGAVAGAVSFEGNARLALYPHFLEIPAGATPPELEAVRGESFCLDLAPIVSKEDYLGFVEKTKDYIASGDVYQACVTYPLLGSFGGSHAAAYLALRKASPAPHAAFCNLGNEVFLLSSSPELFLRINGRKILTRPIKGTRRRSGEDCSTDPFVHELLGSEKERAELVMITDMERSDLGRVCEFGSVRVGELLRVESYRHLHHLVSTVSGVLRVDTGPAAALAACFPGGSISGAPKVRALEILRELEARPRGFYTGSIGWLACDGTAEWNIAIRTLEITGKQASYGTGAGIVADSDPLSEWEETRLKAAAVLSLCC